MLIIYLQMHRTIFLLLCIVLCSSVYDILDFGAIPHSDTVQDQQLNAKAILEAIKAANMSDGERVVRIPDKKFYSYPVKI